MHRPLAVIGAALFSLSVAAQNAWDWTRIGTTNGVHHAGPVGIGTSSPAATLDVSGDIVQTASGTYNGSITGYLFKARRSNGVAGYPDLSGASGGLVLADNPYANSQLVLGSTGATFLGGSLVVSNTTSGATLWMTNAANNSAFGFRNVGSGTQSILKIQRDTLDVMTFGYGGKVAIGPFPADTQAKLHVAGATATKNSRTGGVRGVLHLWNGDDVTNSDIAAITFGGGSSGDAGAASVVGQRITTNGSELFFGTGNQAGQVTNTAMQIDHNGNIGIGATPTANKLTVAGDVTISGTVTGDNIKAKFQDVAEWVPAKEPISPGSVVVLATDAVNHVLRSTSPYDSTVAGVISAQPGITLGEPGEGQVLVATTGRVRVRADASAHPIRIGDLLVTSTKPGMAMRSEPLIINGRRIHEPGTILGKALEPLNAGEGEILVLLSMQ